MISVKDFKIETWKPYFFLQWFAHKSPVFTLFLMTVLKVCNIFNKFSALILYSFRSMFVTNHLNFSSIYFKSQNLKPSSFINSVHNSFSFFFVIPTTGLTTFLYRLPSTGEHSKVLKTQKPWLWLLQQWMTKDFSAKQSPSTLLSLSSLKTFQFRPAKTFLPSFVSTKL